MLTNQDPDTGINKIPTMERVLIRPASAQDIPVIKKLAGRIWPPTYGAILSAAQIRYMLQNMYSPDALRRQQEEQGHRFLILEYDAEPAGFASYSLHAGDGKARLHKIYLDLSLQGKGLGRHLLEAVAARVKAAGCSVLELDVNRQNGARYFYERLGFAVVAEKDTDIGSGFFMNDYSMQRKV